MSAARSRSVVVVVAGTSDSVLAARLSQDPYVTVVLLEAGGPDDYGDEILDPCRAPEVWSMLTNATMFSMASRPTSCAILSPRRTIWTLVPHRYTATVAP